MLIKQLRGSKWVELECEEKDLDQYQGTDTVAILAPGIIWVGNAKWEKKYNADDRFHTVTTTIGLMPYLNYATMIFIENRDERIAIMTADGITETEANKYCDTKPEIYGQASLFEA